MPPKRSKTTTRTNKESQLTPIYHSVSTQTDLDNNSEIANYKKKIKFFETEIENYNKKIIALQSEINVLKNNNENEINFEINNAENLNLPRRSSRVSNEQNIRSVSKANRGCTCKGNCSNKICGCVKKNIPCQEGCKCNNILCRNQESDKENFEGSTLSKDGEQTLEKLELLTLNQEVLHASEKKDKKNQFSPFVECKEFRSAKKGNYVRQLAFDSRRKLFFQNSDDIIDIGNDSENSIIAEPKFLNSKKNCTDCETIQISVPQIPNGDKSSNVEKKKIVKNLMMEQESSEVEVVVDINIQSKEQVSEESNSKDKEPQNLEIDNNQSLVNFNQENNIGIDFNEQNQLIESTQPILKPISQTDINLNSTYQLDANENIDLEDNIKNLDKELNHLNPMIPKHQLARSPVNGNDNIEFKNKHFSPPKKELAAVTVDWNQHKSELIICNICKRTFFDHRIQKHMMSCKGI